MHLSEFFFNTILDCNGFRTNHDHHELVVDLAQADSTLRVTKELALLISMEEPTLGGRIILSPS